VTDEPKEVDEFGIEEHEEALAEELDDRMEDAEGEVRQIPALKYGYIIGLKEDDGEFLFDIIGKNTGIVELMGLHSYAGHRIDVTKDMSTGYGFPILMKTMGQIAEMMKMSLNLLTKAQNKSE